MVQSLVPESHRLFWMPCCVKWRGDLSRRRGYHDYLYEIDNAQSHSLLTLCVSELRRECVGDLFSLATEREEKRG